MPLPQPQDVADTAARSWRPVHAQYALLFLGGIASSLRNAATYDALHATQYGAKAAELEIDVGDLARAIRENPLDLPGGVLSLRLCTLLACETESQLAETLAVPLAIVLAGRARMYAMAERMVSAGRATDGTGQAHPIPGASANAVGPSPTL